MWCNTDIWCNKDPPKEKSEVHSKLRAYAWCLCEAVMQNVKPFSRHCNIRPLSGFENSILIFWESTAVEDIVSSWLEHSADGNSDTRSISIYSSLDLHRRTMLWTPAYTGLCLETLPSLLKLNNKRASHMNARCFVVVKEVWIFLFPFSRKAPISAIWTRWLSSAHF